MYSLGILLKICSDAGCLQDSTANTVYFNIRPLFLLEGFLVTLSINLRSGCMTPLFPPSLPGLLLLRKKRKSSVFAESFPLLLSPPLGLDSGNTQSVCIPCSICSRLHAFQLPLGLVRGDTVSALLTPLIGSMPPFSKCRRGQ